MLKMRYIISLPCILFMTSVVNAQVIVDQREPYNMINNPYNPVMAAAQDQPYPYSPMPTDIYPYNPKTQSYYSYSYGGLSDGSYYYGTGRAGGCACRR